LVPYWKGGAGLDGHTIPPRQASNSRQRLSRRVILGRAVGVATFGAAGGAVVAAESRGSAEATTVQQGALAPTVVMLTDAPTIAVDASLGDDYRVTIAASRVMGSPTNPSDGQQIIFQVTQGTAGSSTITWDSGYEFSAGLPQPTLSTAAGDTDLLGFVYNEARGMWLLAAFVNGFS
jgi:hypothetical protein